MASEINSRNLNDLRVSDLREELEKRGLDKTGVKSVLVKRLQQALSEESFNSEADTKENTEMEASTELDQDVMDETMNVEDMQEIDNATIDMDPEDVDPNDMVVQDELDTSIGDENDHKEIATEGAKKEEDTNADNKAELKKLEIKVEDCLPRSRPGPASSKLNNSGAHRTSAVSVTPEKPAENQADQEDSINLTIGEDEEKLLQEADDSHHRHKGPDAKQQSKNQMGNQESSKVVVVKQERVDEEQSVAAPGAEQDTEMGKSSSGGGDKKHEDKSESKPQPGDGKTSSSNTSKMATKEEKESTKKASTQSTSRNLWVSGLAGSTRATDLKQVFSKYGKVIGAKVVTNARTPGARCYGYVTMATNEDATRCIHNLHRTELHGRMVSVERAKSDSAVLAKKESAKTAEGDVKNEAGNKTGKPTESTDGSKSVKAESTAAEDDAIPEKTGEDADDSKLSDTKSMSKDKDDSVSRKSRSKHSSKSRDRDRSPRSRKYKSDASRERKLQVLSFQQIRAEREKQRMRDRERALREEERRRREESLRNREVERWQREEAHRLAKEREKLQREREKIERERVEILKLERTRQKLERERLEFERMELKRQQMKIEEARMAAKRSALDRRDPYPPPHDNDRKRPAMNERRMEAPPPPRFDQVSSSVGAGPGPGGRSSAYEGPDLLSKKLRTDYGKRDDLRKNDSRGGADFKRGGSDFDILPRHSAGGGGGGSAHMMHSSHASHQGSIIKYPVQGYDDRGRDNADMGSRQDPSSAGPLSTRSKESSRYGDRSSDRGTGLSYRGSDRDGGRRPIEAPDHRSSSGSKMPPRSSSRERRYVDSNIKDGGRYNDRGANSSWHASSGSSSSKPYGGGGLSSNSGPGGLNSGPNMVSSNNPWGNDSRSKQSSQNQASTWRQVDTGGSNDRWSRTPLYPPGVSPSPAIGGNSSSYMDLRYNMSSIRKY